MTDCSKLIRELEASGITIYKLSLMMKCHHSQVRRWKAGTEPRESKANRLREIHREYVA